MKIQVTQRAIAFPISIEVWRHADARLVRALSETRELCREETQASEILHNI